MPDVLYTRSLCTHALKEKQEKLLLKRKLASAKWNFQSIFKSFILCNTLTITKLYTVSYNILVAYCYIQFRYVQWKVLHIYCCYYIMDVTLKYIFSVFCRGVKAQFRGKIVTAYTPVLA